MKDRGLSILEWIGCFFVPPACVLGFGIALYKKDTKRTKIFGWYFIFMLFLHTVLSTFYDSGLWGTTLIDLFNN